MAYPAIDKYNEAVQKPPLAFVDPVLQKGHVASNAFGLPIALGGGFALTYTVSNSGKKFAVRCFHKEAKGLQERYAKISSTLAAISNSNFVGFQYQQSGIRVEGVLYPIVRMDWADGETLGIWLENNYKNKAALTQLLTSFRGLEKFLREKGIAHGDLQNGNVLVDKGTVKLIDYDGLFVPGLPPGQGNELGHKHFQHPKRQGSDFGPSMDRFSFIAIDLSLRALAEKPALFDKHSNGENILFSAGDYLDPASSAVFTDIRAIPSLTQDAEALAKICRAPIANVPSLDDFLAGRNIPATVVSFPAPGQRPAAAGLAMYVGAYDIIDASDYMAALRRAGDRVELVGRIVELKEAKTRYGRPYVFVNFGSWKGNIVKLSIWSDGLKKLTLKPDQSWVGRWISVVGLLEPPFINPKYNYSHISITIEEGNQYRFIDAAEAQRRLASIGKTVGTASATSGKNQAILATINGGSESLPGRIKKKSGKASPSPHPPVPPMSSNKQVLEQIRRQANAGVNTSTSGPSYQSRTLSGQGTSQTPTPPKSSKSGIPAWLVWVGVALFVFLLIKARH
ncbi:MAG: serine/threonine protein kinase [Alphaproteobacteria bacterium]|nr:serine/threonine protein kinase [Alphaproteobacteria bacterium]